MTLRGDLDSLFVQSPQLRYSLPALTIVKSLIVTVPAPLIASALVRLWVKRMTYVVLDDFVTCFLSATTSYCGITCTKDRDGVLADITEPDVGERARA